MVVDKSVSPEMGCVAASSVVSRPGERVLDTSVSPVLGC